MKPGELAKHTGVTAETIRYYEKIGLLTPPVRLANNFREYGEMHIRQLEFIRRCRALGLGLEDIRLLLASVNDPSAECANEAHRLIQSHLVTVEEQIHELTQLRKSLNEPSHICRGGHARGEFCPLLDALRHAPCEQCGEVCRCPHEHKPGTHKA